MRKDMDGPERSPIRHLPNNSNHLSLKNTAIYGKQGNHFPQTIYLQDKCGTTSRAQAPCKHGDVLRTWSQNDHATTSELILRG